MENFTDLFGDDLDGIDGLGDFSNATGSGGQSSLQSDVGHFTGPAGYHPSKPSTEAFGVDTSSPSNFHHHTQLYGAAQYPTAAAINSYPGDPNHLMHSQRLAAAEPRSNVTSTPFHPQMQQYTQQYHHDLLPGPPDMNSWQSQNTYQQQQQHQAATMSFRQHSTGSATSNSGYRQPYSMQSPGGVSSGNTSDQHHMGVHHMHLQNVVHQQQRVHHQPMSVPMGYSNNVRAAGNPSVGHQGLMISPQGFATGPAQTVPLVGGPSNQQSTSTNPYSPASQKQDYINVPYMSGLTPNQQNQSYGGSNDARYGVGGSSSPSRRMQHQQRMEFSPQPVANTPERKKSTSKAAAKETKSAAKKRAKAMAAQAAASAQHNLLQGASPMQHPPGNLTPLPMIQGGGMYDRLSVGNQQQMYHHRMPYQAISSPSSHLQISPGNVNSNMGVCTTTSPSNMSSSSVQASPGGTSLQQLEQMVGPSMSKPPSNDSMMNNNSPGGQWPSQQACMQQLSPHGAYGVIPQNSRYCSRPTDMMEHVKSPSAQQHMQDSRFNSMMRHQSQIHHPVSSGLMNSNCSMSTATSSSSSDNFVGMQQQQMMQSSLPPQVYRTASISPVVRPPPPTPITALQSTENMLPHSHTNSGANFVDSSYQVPSYSPCNKTLVPSLQSCDTETSCTSTIPSVDHHATSADQNILGSQEINIPSPTSVIVTTAEEVPSKIPMLSEEPMPNELIENNDEIAVSSNDIPTSITSSQYYECKEESMSAFNDFADTELTSQTTFCQPIKNDVETELGEDVSQTELESVHTPEPNNDAMVSTTNAHSDDVVVASDDAAKSLSKEYVHEDVESSTFNASPLLEEPSSILEQQNSHAETSPSDQENDSFIPSSTDFMAALHSVPVVSNVTPESPCSNASVSLAPNLDSDETGVQMPPEMEVQHLQQLKHLTTLETSADIEEQTTDVKNCLQDVKSTLPDDEGSNTCNPSTDENDSLQTDESFSSFVIRDNKVQGLTIVIEKPKKRSKKSKASTEPKPPKSPKKKYKKKNKEERELLKAAEKKRKEISLDVEKQSTSVLTNDEDVSEGTNADSLFGDATSNSDTTIGANSDTPSKLNKPVRAKLKKKTPLKPKSNKTLLLQFAKKKRRDSDDSGSDVEMSVTPPPEDSEKRRSGRHANRERQKYVDEVQLNLTEEELFLPLAAGANDASGADPTERGLSSDTACALSKDMSDDVEESFDEAPSGGATGQDNISAGPNYAFIDPTVEDSMIIQTILSYRMGVRELESESENENESDEKITEAESSVKSVEKNDDIEKVITDQKEEQDGTVKKSPNKQSSKTIRVEEFLVKFKNFSYLHCQWLTEEEMVRGDRRIGQKIKRYKQKRERSRNLMDFCEEEYFNPDYVEVDRVLDCKELIEETADGSSQVVKHYLVKWCSLPYEDCTWEVEADVDVQKIRDFEHWRKPSLEESSINTNVYKRRGRKHEWKKMEESLIYKNGNSLRDYQLEGVNWLLFSWYNGRNCLLADEMGLGKTIQSLAFLESIFKYGISGPFLIIAPLSTIPNWQREFELWSEMNVIVYHGSQTSRNMLAEYEMYYQQSSNKSTDDAEAPKSQKRRLDAFKFHVLITTYECVIIDILELMEIKWRACVIDEAHRLKNKNCKLLEGLQLLDIESRLLLSGTPLQNNINELFSLLSFLEPSQFSSSDAFLREFGDMQNEDQVKKLQALLKPLMLRRMKEDVEKSLKPKEETIVEVELTNMQKKYYRGILERNFSFITKGATNANVPNLMNTMMELRKCCIHPYLLNGAEEQIQNDYRTRKTDYDDDEGLYFQSVINASGKMVLLNKLLPKLKENSHRVLIFSQMVKMLDILEDYLVKKKYPYERIDGQIRGNLRQAAIDRFCRPDSDRFVFLLCTKAGGLGINLVAADTVIIYDSDWNPQNDLQAQARCHRIGQSKMVKIYRLVTRNTYEREMFDRASLKLGLDKAVLQSMNTKIVSGDKPAAGGAAGLTKKEIEDLLKKGAYGALMDDDNAGDKFCEEDIEDILLRRTTTVNLNSEDKAGGSFSKASFASNDTVDDIAIDDPDFWAKWAKKADIQEQDDSNPLMLSEPRSRRKIQRFGRDDIMDSIRDSDLGSSSDSDGASYRNRNRKSGLRSLRRRKQLDVAEEIELVDDGLEVEYGGWTRGELFRIEKALMLFGWGRWSVIKSESEVRSGFGLDMLEAVCRLTLLYCLNIYRGDENIKSFVWDLIKPTELGGCNKVSKNHCGLTAPAPRGRKARNMRLEAEAKMKVPSNKKASSNSTSGNGPDVAWVSDDKYDMEIYLDQVYRKHLDRQNTKILLRIRMLYYIVHGILPEGTNVEEFTLPGFQHENLKGFLNPAPVIPEGPPVPWWDVEADKSLIIGTIKHGYERYSRMQADPSLCFLQRCGAPIDAAETGSLLAQTEDKEEEQSNTYVNDLTEETEKIDGPETKHGSTINEDEHSDASHMTSVQAMVEPLLTFPSFTDLNCRLRRLISARQKEVRKEENRSKRNERRERFEMIMRAREHTKLQQYQVWTRRDESDFLKTVVSFGLDYTTSVSTPKAETDVDDDSNSISISVLSKSPKRRHYAWDRFRQLSRMDKKLDSTFDDFAFAFKAVLKHIAGKKISSEEDAARPLVHCLDGLSPSKAGYVLQRIDLMDRIRHRFLMRSDLEKTLFRLCKPDKELPTWWIPGKHDHDLLKGVARNGLARSEYFILNDPELSFKDILTRHLSGENVFCLKLPDTSDPVAIKQNNTLADKKMVDIDVESVVNQEEISLKKSVDNSVQDEQVSAEDPVRCLGDVGSRRRASHDSSIAIGDQASDLAASYIDFALSKTNITDPPLIANYASLAGDGQAFLAAVASAIKWPKDSVLEVRLNRVVRCLESGKWISSGLHMDSSTTDLDQIALRTNIRDNDCNRATAMYDAEQQISDSPSGAISTPSLLAAAMALGVTSSSVNSSLITNTSISVTPTISLMSSHVKDVRNNHESEQRLALDHSSNLIGHAKMPYDHDDDMVEESDSTVLDGRDGETNVTFKESACLSEGFDSVNLCSTSSKTSSGKSSLMSTLERLSVQKGLKHKLSENVGDTKSKKMKRLDDIMCGLSAAKGVSLDSTFEKSSSKEQPSSTGKRFPDSKCESQVAATARLTMSPSGSSNINDAKVNKWLVDHMGVVPEIRPLTPCSPVTSFAAVKTQKLSTVSQFSNQELMALASPSMEWMSNLSGEEHVCVFNRITGKKLTGSLGPKLKNLASWLIENPMFEVDPKWAEGIITGGKDALNLKPENRKQNNSPSSKQQRKGLGRASISSEESTSASVKSSQPPASVSKMLSLLAGGADIPLSPLPIASTSSKKQSKNKQLLVDQQPPGFLNSTVDPSLATSLKLPPTSTSLDALKIMDSSSQLLAAIAASGLSPEALESMGLDMKTLNTMISMGVNPLGPGGNNSFPSITGLTPPMTPSAPVDAKLLQSLGFNPTTLLASFDGDTLKAMGFDPKVLRQMVDQPEVSTKANNSNRNTASPTSKNRVNSPSTVSSRSTKGRNSSSPSAKQNVTASSVNAAHNMEQTLLRSLGLDSKMLQSLGIDFNSLLKMDPKVLEATMNSFDKKLMESMGITDPAKGTQKLDLNKMLTSQMPSVNLWNSATRDATQLGLAGLDPKLLQMMGMDPNITSSLIDPASNSTKTSTSNVSSRNLDPNLLGFDPKTLGFDSKIDPRLLQRFSGVPTGMPPSMVGLGGSPGGIDPLFLQSIMSTDPKTLQMMGIDPQMLQFMSASSLSSDIRPKQPSSSSSTKSGSSIRSAVSKGEKNKHSVASTVSKSTSASSSTVSSGNNSKYQIELMCAAMGIDPKTIDPNIMASLCNQVNSGGLLESMQHTDPLALAAALGGFNPSIMAAAAASMDPSMMSAAAAYGSTGIVPSNNTNAAMDYLKLITSSASGIPSKDAPGLLYPERINKSVSGMPNSSSQSPGKISPGRRQTRSSASPSPRPSSRTSTKSEPDAHRHSSPKSVQQHSSSASIGCLTPPFSSVGTSSSDAFTNISSVATMAGFNPNMFAGIDPKILSNLDPRLLGFDPKLLSGMDPKVLSGLLDPRLLSGSFDATKIAGLDPKIFAGIDPNVLANLDPRFLPGSFDPKLLSGIDPRLLGVGFDPKLLSGIDPKLLNSLDPAVLASMCGLDPLMLAGLGGSAIDPRIMAGPKSHIDLPGRQSASSCKTPPSHTITSSSSKRVSPKHLGTSSRGNGDKNLAASLMDPNKLLSTLDPKQLASIDPKLLMDPKFLAGLDPKLLAALASDINLFPNNLVDFNKPIPPIDSKLKTSSFDSSLVMSLVPSSLSTTVTKELAATSASSIASGVGSSSSNHHPYTSTQKDSLPLLHGLDPKFLQGLDPNFLKSMNIDPKSMSLLMPPPILPLSPLPPASSVTKPSNSNLLFPSLALSPNSTRPGLNTTSCLTTTFSNLETPKMHSGFEKLMSSSPLKPKQLSSLLDTPLTSSVGDSKTSEESMKLLTSLVPDLNSSSGGNISQQVLTAAMMDPKAIMGIDPKILSKMTSGFCMPQVGFPDHSKIVPNSQHVDPKLLEAIVPPGAPLSSSIASLQPVRAEDLSVPLDLIKNNPISTKTSTEDEINMNLSSSFGEGSNEDDEQSNATTSSSPSKKNVKSKKKSLTKKKKKTTSTATTTATATNDVDNMLNNHEDNGPVNEYNEAHSPTSSMLGVEVDLCTSANSIKDISSPKTDEVVDYSFSTRNANKKRRLDENSPETLSSSSTFRPNADDNSSPFKSDEKTEKTTNSSHRRTRRNR